VLRFWRPLVSGGSSIEEFPLVLRLSRGGLRVERMYAGWRRLDPRNCRMHEMARLTDDRFGKGRSGHSTLKTDWSITFAYFASFYFLSYDGPLFSHLTQPSLFSGGSLREELSWLPKYSGTLRGPLHDRWEN